MSFCWYFRRIVLTFFDACLHFIVNFDFAYTFDLLIEINISMTFCMIFINFFICRFVFFVWLLYVSSMNESVSLFVIRFLSFSRKISTFIFFQFFVKFDSTALVRKFNIILIENDLNNCSCFRRCLFLSCCLWIASSCMWNR